MIQNDEPQAIGVILPDDGPFAYEWLQLEAWLANSRYADLRVLVERSPADGVMQELNLLAIGSAQSLSAPARRLVERGADCILWCCTSGSFAGGYAAGLRQVEMLTEATGLPATSTSLALASAALAIEAPQVDLLSAYDGPTTRLFVDFLANAGVTVIQTRTLDCITTEDSVAVDILEEVRAFAAGVPSDRPLLVPDTAINTLSLVPELCRVAQRRVLTANMASLWAAAGLLRRAPADARDGLAG